MVAAEKIGGSWRAAACCSGVQGEVERDSRQEERPGEPGDVTRPDVFRNI